jgi:hypothetical protein
LCWSRHQPGYVQGGQGVGRDYLLVLRIHVRRIRGIDIYRYFVQWALYIFRYTLRR